MAKAVSLDAVGANPALMAITNGDAFEVQSEPTPLYGQVLPGLLIGLFGLQVFFSMFLDGHPVRDFGLSAQAMTEGRWHTLLTHMFIHGGIGHIVMNATFAAAVSAPVAVALSLNVRGVLRFGLFFLVCGLAAALAYLAVHPDEVRPMVGASGALSGLWAAIARLTETPGRLAAPWSRSVWRSSAMFLLINVVLMGLLSGLGLPIAWEAHLGGFVAGLLLFGAFVPPPGSPSLETDDHQPEQGA